jgi:Leucine-rich repeat (LRR) protein
MLALLAASCSAATTFDLITEARALCRWWKQLPTNDQSVLSSWQCLAVSNTWTVCNSWLGVKCSPSGRHIVTLDLSNLGLVGPSTLLTSIGRLRRLKTLSLPGIGLEFNIPTQLGLLTRLQYLDLSNNGLTGSVPSKLNGASSLTWINLSFNQLTRLPATFGSLTKLVTIGLNNNNLEGTVPRRLGRLTAPTLFNIYSNSLQGTLPQALCQLTALAAQPQTNDALCQTCTNSNGGGGLPSC